MSFARGFKTKNIFPHHKVAGKYEWVTKDGKYRITRSSAGGWIVVHHPNSATTTTEISLSNASAFPLVLEKFKNLFMVQAWDTLFVAQAKPLQNLQHLDQSHQDQLNYLQNHHVIATTLMRQF